MRAFTAGYGDIPDLSVADSGRDIVFAWNGTTSGVRVPNADWIADNRTGLTLCDATSAVFAQDLPWDKLDVTTWSWQKVLGGEAAHGMIVLSPRAIERLQSYIPTWPMPKIFCLANKGKVIEGIFVGDTINTPSMIAVEDCIDALKWVQSIGGLSATQARSNQNLSVIQDWVANSHWADFLAHDPKTRSNTSICLKIKDPAFLALSPDSQESVLKTMVKLLAHEKVAYDIASYRDAPLGLRIWGGATVESSDIQALLPWLDWAYQSAL
jgi:phosphoserine aminotransferase